MEKYQYVETFVHIVAPLIEVLGIGIIILGGVAALMLFLVRVVRSFEIMDHYKELRKNLGRAILLGLEFLVAADIVRTITIKPSFTSVGVLAVIVLIRTFLSFSLEVEIEGRWPWQREES